jgi:hypothetical protein
MTQKLELERDDVVIVFRSIDSKERYSVTVSGPPLVDGIPMKGNQYAAAAVANYIMDPDNMQTIMEHFKNNMKKESSFE